MKTLGKYKSSGWFRDSYRHSLAAKGIKTRNSFYVKVGDYGSSSSVDSGVNLPVANYLKGNRETGQVKSDAAFGISKEERALIDQGIMEGPKRKFGEVDKNLIFDDSEISKNPTPSSEIGAESRKESEPIEQQAQPVEGRLPQKEEVIPPRSESDLTTESVGEPDRITISDLGLEPASVDDIPDIRF